eukprot:TRINITY_DN772_c0_g2_i1.p2 TRINITY_DN772_c0_g2~~TRINITY_DN772_c0_g2_i1.p2  ORF type:complete len:55 (-),score=17.12 TRINITY_DN772_c0_g2_i1:2-166(-)
MFTFLSQIITLKGGRIALQLTPTLISSGPQKDCSPHVLCVDTGRSSETAKAHRG